MGNRPLPAPKVTFAVFAYNQEKYVREAIEGAFAQTLESMEIILSDDGSSDGTFAIMQQMAAAYEGPHRIIVRQEKPNVGTVRHVINVARAGHGELLIVNAGDDISYPDRSASLYRAYRESSPSALSSWHDEIDESGRTLRRGLSFPPSPITASLFSQSTVARREKGAVASVPGFCAAYPRHFWADMPQPSERLLVEDGLATILINLAGGTIVRVPHSLIAYRLLDHSLSNRQGATDADSLALRENKIETLARDQWRMIDFIFTVVDDRSLAVDKSTRRRLERHRNHGRIITGFWSVAPIVRFRRLVAVRSRLDAAFIMPRLLGRPLFTVFREAVERVRSTIQGVGPK
jgi:glycosyltransferase involved in cell wall biosynthesis